MREFFGRLVIAPLSAWTTVPTPLQELIFRAATRLLDSELVITYRPTVLVDFPHQPPGVKPALSDLLKPIEAAVAGARTEGLAPHFRPLMRGFREIMSSLFLDEAQQARGREALANGQTLCFLMTDGGGPNLAGWRTKVIQEGTRTFIHVHKIWAIDADRFKAANIVARQDGVMYPVAYRVYADQCAKLQRTPVGAPFLDGAFQLGNVTGIVEVFKEDRIWRAGPTAMNRLLTMVRPQLVRALMSHLLWLADVGRLQIDDQDRAVIDCVAEIGAAIARSADYRQSSVASALALKFTSNEILVDLVARGCVIRAEDQRDLLGFSKMEGSSYRCFREVWAAAQSRAPASRDAAAPRRAMMAALGGHDR